MEEFRIGDRVEVIEEYHNCPVGTKGIVRQTDANIGIEMDEATIYGHNLYGRCPSGKGYYLPPQNLRIIEKEIHKKFKDSPKEEVISYFDERERRITNNFREELENLRSRQSIELNKLQTSFYKILPNVDDLYSKDMFYYKTESMGSDKFAIAKKDSLDIDKYILSKQIFSLPEELKIKKYYVCLLAMFNNKHNHIGYAILNSKMGLMSTFHSYGFKACLGDNKEAFKDIKLNDADSIIRGFNELKKTFEVINMYSPMIDSSFLPEKFKKVVSFIKSKIDEQSRAERRCRHCESPYEECECSVCDDCDELIDNCSCDFCSNCDRRIESSNYDSCDCWYCSDCEADFRQDEECDCEMCDSCHLRLRTENGYDICHCGDESGLVNPEIGNIATN